MNFRRLRKRLFPKALDLAARRRWRDRMLALLGLERSHKPLALVEHQEYLMRSMLRFLVSHEIARKPDFTFLQIGAYDGVGDDDLREIVMGYRLRGVLVEPQPSAFDRLRRNYANQRQVTLLNAAIAEIDGLRDFYCPRQGDAMVASFDREHLRRHGIPSAEIVSRKIDCYTVQSALRVGGLDRVDLLQIDAEGHDYEILNSLDLAHLHPAIIRFEHRHMCRRHADMIISRMAEHGYRFITEPTNIIGFLGHGKPWANAAA